MQLINATRMTAGYTLALEPSARELLVVVIKGTFVLPKTGEPVRLADEQDELVTADTFGAEPGTSAPVHEVDYAPYKPSCDVLLAGSAHAPDGRPATRASVGLQVGSVSKRFDVVGERAWQAGLTGVRAGAPQPFERLPISYDVAFGGVAPDGSDAYAPNPVGRGFGGSASLRQLDGRPLPATEEAGQPVTSPGGHYAPMAFGPVGRGWPQRARFAGTYDQHWLDDVFPFLPADFDARYHQAAPADQQMPLPRGPVDVVLAGLTPDGHRAFTLPHFDAPLHVFPKDGGREDLVAVLDTIVLEPDRERLTMTWRAARPLRKGLHELKHVLVGKKGRDWWQLRERVAFPIPVVMMPMEKAESP